MKQFYFLFSVAFSCALSAGNDNIPIGARQAGIAHTAVTLSDVWAVHHNQAGLGFVQKSAAGVYYENRFLLPELGLSGAVLALPVKTGTFGLSIRNFGYSLYSESKIGLAYGRAFGEQLSIGIQLNYQNVRFADVYGVRNMFTAEIGAIYKLSPELTVGAHVYNPNRTRLSDFADERLPAVMRLGLRYQFSDKLFIAGETEKDSHNDPVFRGGIEYVIADVLVLRTGISGNPLNNTFGIGLRMKKLQLDLAGTFHPVLGFTPQFSLTYQFRD